MMADDKTEEDPADLRWSETEPLSEGPAAGEARPEIGETLADRYTIFGRVGDGGMGTVYRAEDLELHELVALKLLDSDAARDDEAVDQFRREVKLARRVAHRNVVRTYDYGTADDRPFLTMEYVDGFDLRTALQREQLEAPRVVATGEAVAAGLAEAHRVGIIHRDLKPENVLVGNRGRIAVSDFGIAGALRGGDPEDTIRQAGAGTPAYMASEQLRARDDMDHRVDVYAFGVLMFELLTGELLWADREDALSTALARLDSPGTEGFEQPGPTTSPTAEVERTRPVTPDPGRAVDEALTDLMWMQHCPLFESLRETTPFQDQVDRARRRIEQFETNRI